MAEPSLKIKILDSYIRCTINGIIVFNQKIVKSIFEYEDISKDAEKEAQDITDKYIVLIEKHLEAKEKEIMAV